MSSESDFDFDSGSEVPDTEDEDFAFDSQGEANDQDDEADDIFVDSDEDQTSVNKSKASSAKNAKQTTTNTTKSPSGSNNDKKPKSATKSPQKCPTGKKLDEDATGPATNVSSAAKASAMKKPPASASKPKDAKARSSSGKAESKTKSAAPKPSTSSKSTAKSSSSGAGTATAGAGSGSGLSKGGIPTAPVKKDSEAVKIIKDYMINQNRPYSVQNVLDNMRKMIGKTMIQKSLDSLVSSGDLRAKDYGKSRIYWANQDRIASKECTPAALQDMEREGKALEQKREGMMREARELDRETSSLLAQPSDKDLQEMIKKEEKEVEEREKRLALIKHAVGAAGKSKRHPPGYVDKIRRQFHTYRTEWVKRRRLTNDAVYTLADAMEKKGREVEVMIGVENDEDADVKIPEGL